MQPARRKTHQSHAWRALFKKQFHKTKLCRYYNLGQCRYGQDCPFAHDQSELAVAPDLTKTTICEAWLAGQCRLPPEQCQYAHGEEELRVTPAFSTSTLCKRRSGQDGNGDELEQASQPQGAPVSVGYLGNRSDPSWAPEVGGMGMTHPGQEEEAPVLPVGLGLQGAVGGALWSHDGSGLMPDFHRAPVRESYSPPASGKGNRRKNRVQAGGNIDRSVVHLADHLVAEEGTQRKGGGKKRSSAMLPRNSGWMPPNAAAPWPGPAAMQGVPASMPAATTGASVPAPSHVPVPQMFGMAIPDGPVPDTAARADFDKSVDMKELIARCTTVLADAQTATPGSLASLSSASPMRWVRTPSSAASPERTEGGFWDHTPSPTLSPTLSPRRKSLPAYVEPIGMVTFRELPEEERIQQEPPGSPEVRWARTPSTVASPSVSPPRRVGGGIRLTHRGPPAPAELHRLDDIFRAVTREQGGAASGSDAPWGTMPWPAAPGGPIQPSPGPQVVSPPLGVLGSPWGGAAQAFERILEGLPQAQESLGVLQHGDGGETRAR